MVGGTSLAAPLISGMVALAGNAGSLSTAEYIYRHRVGLRDIVGGRNSDSRTFRRRDVEYRCLNADLPGLEDEGIDGVFDRAGR